MRERDVAGKRRAKSRWAMRMLPRVTMFIAAALIFMIASTAAALTRDELIKLKEQKVPDSVVVNLVNGSGPINLSKDDVEMLKSLGAGPELIKTLEDGGHVLVDASGSGGDVQTSCSTDADCGPDQRCDLAKGVCYELGAGALEAEEARRKAEEDARIRAEAEKLRVADRERDAKQAELNKLISKLTEAERALGKGRNMSAAKIYLEFLGLGPDPASEEFYRAKCGLAKALFNEKVYSGAAVPVLDVLMQGPEKSCFDNAFGMLRVLTKENGYAPPQLEELAQFYIENKTQKFQDEYHYYLGRFFYDYRKLDLAFKYLDKVGDKSGIKAKALYLTGVAQIDPEVKKYRSAVQNFQKAIIAAESNDEKSPEVRELGYLALARVAYEATNYDGALFYYNKIEELSPRRSTALFESSWTYFLKNDYKRAMGSFHSLSSPYYEQWYYPDVHILEATVYLNLCKFGNAKEALAVFKEKYLDQQPVLQDLLKTTLKPEDYYNALVSFYNARDNGEETALAMVFVQAVLNNADFFNSHRVINNLSKEQGALEANLEGLGEFGETVLTQVEEAKRNQLLEAGIKVQQILTGVDRELTDWSIKADEIDFEIDSARVEEAKNKLQNPDYVPPKALEGTTLFVVADDWQFWPFEGEYWIDEVANYKSFLRTECIEK